MKVIEAVFGRRQGDEAKKIRRVTHLESASSRATFTAGIRASSVTVAAARVLHTSKRFMNLRTGPILSGRVRNFHPRIAAPSGNRTVLSEIRVIDCFDAVHLDVSR